MLVRILSYDCGTVQMVRFMLSQSDLSVGTISIVLLCQAVEITIVSIILVK